MKKFTIEPNQYEKIASILIPTRNRMIPTFHNDGFAQEGGLISTLESIYNTTEDKDSVEIILRVDDDDTNTLDNLHLLNKYDEAFEIRILKGSRYRGYVDLWKMWNELAHEAKGEFLVLFSDDVTMESVGWEKLLQKHSGKVGVVRSTYTEGMLGQTEDFLLCPCIHNKIVELQGRMEFHESVDLKWTIWNRLAKEKGYDFVIPEMGIQMSHKCMGGEHVRDNMPASDPGGVTRHVSIIESDLQRVIDGFRSCTDEINSVY